MTVRIRAFEEALRQLEAEWLKGEIRKRQQKFMDKLSPKKPKKETALN
jgi:uncharacterized protein YifE (UPF0438 family)